MIINVSNNDILIPITDTQISTDENRKLFRNYLNYIRQVLRPSPWLFCHESNVEIFVKNPLIPIISNKKDLVSRALFL